MKHFFVIALVLLILTMVYTTEGFELNCGQYTDCKTCAVESGCSWCPKTTSCVYTSELKSTDVCNQMNVINASSQCDVKSTYDIYKNQIKNKIPPPNAYSTGEIKYTNEDVISTLDNMRNELNNMKTENKNLRADIPGMLSELPGSNPYSFPL